MQHWLFKTIKASSGNLDEFTVNNHKVERGFKYMSMLPKLIFINLFLGLGDGSDGKVSSDLAFHSYGFEFELNESLAKEAQSV